jgi:uncharacterized membrane protein YqjE
MAGRTHTDPTSGESVADLLKQLSEQTSRLASLEVALAKAEAREKGKQAGVGASMLGGASLFGLLASGTLTAALVLALATAMNDWLAALIVGVVYLVIAGVLVLIGRQRLRRAAPFAPEQTTESVKEDVEWVKNQARSARQ